MAVAQIALESDALRPLCSAKPTQRRARGRRFLAQVLGLRFQIFRLGVNLLAGRLQLRILLGKGRVLLLKAVHALQQRLQLLANLCNLPIRCCRLRTGCHRCKGRRYCGRNQQILH